jgi:hypothetical protein
LKTNASISRWRSVNSGARVSVPPLAISSKMASAIAIAVMPSGPDGSSASESGENRGDGVGCPGERC